jgi:hypothetical protein
MTKTVALVRRRPVAVVEEMCPVINAIYDREMILRLIAPDIITYGVLILLLILPVLVLPMGTATPAMLTVEPALQKLRVSSRVRPRPAATIQLPRVKMDRFVQI